MGLRLPDSERSDRPWTVVWIDARVAVVARWDGTEERLTRFQSDVPARRRSTGHVTHSPTIRHGGGGGPSDAGEARRLEHLARFLDRVAEHIGPADAVEILGPGTIHERLASQLARADATQRRERPVHAAHAAPMSDAQLRAELRLRAGVPRPRGRRPAAGSGPRRGRPLRAPEVEERELDEFDELAEVGVEPDERGLEAEPVVELPVA